jgi:hypothetical protein
MINPGNAEAYQAPNDGCDDVSKHITDDIKGNQGWRTNIQMPFEKDIEELKPDLSAKITNYVSVTSGFSTQIAPKNGIDETPISDTFFANKLITSVSSGRNSTFQTPIYASNFFETEHEEKLMPAVSSGFEHAKIADGHNAVPNAVFLEDEKLNPILQTWQHSVYTRDGQSQYDKIQLQKKTSQGALTSGVNVRGASRLEETKLGMMGRSLTDKRPTYSAISYADIPIKKQCATDGAKKNGRERRLATGNYYGTLNSSVLPVKDITSQQASVMKMNGSVKRISRKKKMNL